MKFLPAFFAVFALLHAGNPACAQQKYKINLHRESPIYFSNNKTPDLLMVDAVGSTAFNAAILITIRRTAKDRYPLFVTAVVAKKTTAINWQEFSMDYFNEVVSRILFKSSRKTADLPSWDNLKKSGRFCDSADICPQVEKDVYERVRSSGRPLFCYNVHYENISCAWFDDKWGSGRFVTRISW